MQTVTRKQWWQQLGGMSQGMLFVQGHLVPSDSPAPASAQRYNVHDATGQARHREAVQRLSARRLRAMTSLSLFR